MVPRCACQVPLIVPESSGTGHASAPAKAVKMTSVLQSVKAHPILTFSLCVGVPYFFVFVALQKKCFGPKTTKTLTRFYFRPTAPLLIGYQRFVKKNRKPTLIGEGVYLGTFPSATLGDVRHLHENLRVGGVINLMDEWQGPVAAYSKYGIEQLWLPTIDHVEPSVSSMEMAVEFIKKIRAKVCVWCVAFDYFHLVSISPTVVGLFIAFVGGKCTSWSHSMPGRLQRSLHSLQRRSRSKCGAFLLLRYHFAVKLVVATTTIFSRKVLLT